jgi:hypothetical protein
VLEECAAVGLAVWDRAGRLGGASCANGRQRAAQSALTRVDLMYRPELIGALREAAEALGARVRPGSRSTRSRISVIASRRSSVAVSPAVSIW